MQERQLNFKTNDDPTLVVLTDAQAKELKKSSDDLRFAMANLQEWLSKGTLEVGMKDTLASLIETYAQKITNSLGYAGVLQAENEERHAEIRSLNTQNRELRKQLGEKNSPEDVRESLKNISENFKRWWNIEGFGHVSEVSFGGYGFQAKVSGMITDSYYSKDEDYKDEAQKADFLRDYGFVIVGEGRHNRDNKVVACDSNFKLIDQLIKTKYPSAKVLETKLYCRRNAEFPEFREIEIFISNFDELFESKADLDD